MKNALKALVHARMSLSYTDTQKSIAYRKTRTKPEDVMERRVLYVLGAAIVSFFRRFGRFFFNRGRKYHPVKHASGFFGKSALRPRAPKWFRQLQAQHFGEIPLQGRAVRKLARESC